MPDNAYKITVSRPFNMSESSLGLCHRLILSGHAISPEANIPKNLKRASYIAIAQYYGVIIGCGVVKTIRPKYIEQVKLKSGFAFSNRPEIGYLNVREDHRRNHVAGMMLESLVQKYPERLFAVLSGFYLHKGFKNAGFSQVGFTWQGQNDSYLSLWIKQ